MASGLDPEKVLKEYPESMSRALLNAARMKAEMPPRWVIEMLDAMAKGFGKKQKKKPSDRD